MQKIQPKKTNKKRILIILTVVSLLLLIGFTAYAYSNNTNLVDKSNEQNSTKEESTPDTQPTSKSSIDDEDAKAPVQSDDVDITQPANEVPVAEKTTVTITELSQNNGNVSYRSDVSGNQNGTCSALFESDRGKPVTRTTETANGSCAASIPAMEFDAPGTWTLTLRFYTDNTQAIAKKDIVIR